MSPPLCIFISETQAEVVQVNDIPDRAAGSLQKPSSIDDLLSREPEASGQGSIESEETLPVYGIILDGESIKDGC